MNTAATSNASAQTVRECLREHGLKAKKPASKPRLTQDSVDWTVTHHRWTCGRESFSRMRPGSQLPTKTVGSIIIEDRTNVMLK